MKRYEAILDINSSSLRLIGLVYEYDAYGRCFCERRAHAGMKGQTFDDPIGLRESIRELIEEFHSSVGRGAKTVRLVLPQKLFRTEHNSVRAIAKGEFVNKYDVAEALEKSALEIEGCAFLECEPIAFDVGDRYVDNPAGLECREFGALTATVAILSSVDEYFADVSKRLGVNFEYVPKMKYALRRLQRELDTAVSPRIAICVNEDFTDVCYCEMRSVIDEKVVDFGSNDLIDALAANVKGADRAIAAELAERLNLNVSEGRYASLLSRQAGFSIEETNKAARDALSEMFGMISREIGRLTGDAPLDAYIFGDKVCEIRGFDALIAKHIGSKVVVLKSDELAWNGAEDYNISELAMSLAFDGRRTPCSVDAPDANARERRFGRRARKSAGGNHVRRNQD